MNIMNTLTEGFMSGNQPLAAILAQKNEHYKRKRARGVPSDRPRNLIFGSFIRLVSL